MKQGEMDFGSRLPRKPIAVEPADALRQFGRLADRTERKQLLLKRIAVGADVHRVRLAVLLWIEDPRLLPHPADQILRTPVGIVGLLRSLLRRRRSGALADRLVRFQEFSR